MNPTYYESISVAWALALLANLLMSLMDIRNIG